jgi:hypothetical protein
MATVEEIAQFALAETRRRLDRGEEVPRIWEHVSRRFPDATEDELQAACELSVARLGAQQAKRQGQIN